MIERVYYRVKLDANTFIYTPYLSNIPTSITDIPTNVTYDTTDGITLKTKETWTYDNNESSSVTAEREIPLKAGDGVTMDVSEDGKYVVIKVDPKRETYIGTSVPTDDYPDLFVNTTDDSLLYKAPDGSWKPIAGGGSGGGLVDDVLINGVSIVVDKTANIPVDLGTDADSSNPIANKAVVEALNALSTDITNHKNNKQNPHSVTAAQVGLGNVNNTSDMDKPVSSKQAAAIKVAKDDITAHKNNKSNPHMVTAAQVGLGNVNNTSDANKPVSTAQQAALDKKIDKAGGTFSGNVAIQGDLTVSGTTTTESEKQLAVKENVIVTNADKANLQTLLSGLAINKNSTATYGIMYDPADDTVKFGEGTLDANRKFVFKAGEGHPLAIRADSSQFTDAVLVKWNATTKAFEPASGTWQDLLNKIEITDIDLTLGDKTVLYDTTNGIQLSATGKITRKDGTFEQAQVDLDVPLTSGKGIIIDKVVNKEQVEIKVDMADAASSSDKRGILIPFSSNAVRKSIGIGRNYAPDYDYAIGIGDNSYPKKYSIAIGDNAQSGYNSISIGRYANTQPPTDGDSYLGRIAIGNFVYNPILGSILLGFNSETLQDGDKFVLADGLNSSNKHNYFKITKDSSAVYHMFLNGVEVPTQIKSEVGVGTTLPDGSSSEKIFIKTAGNTAKVYYNDNGTWKVVDVQGGGGGSIDADTLNGLLSAGAGISIEKTTAGDKVEVKIDPGVNIVGATFEARDNPTSPVEYTTLRYTGVFEYHNPVGDYKFSLPTTENAGIYQLLASNNVKTLFGNQSIVGSGNIDLFQHVIKITGGDVPYSDCYAYLTIISSKNLNVDSLTDLKTLLGDTFEYPATGYDLYNLAYVYKVTQDGIISTNNEGTSVSLSFADMTEFIDTVTTI